MSMTDKMAKIKITKLIIVCILTIFFFVNLEYGLKFNPKPIRIRNECNKKESKFACERKFDVPNYFEGVKNDFGKIIQNRTIIEKFAGANPDLFKYSIGFTDKSYIKVWVDSNLQSGKNDLGGCNFSNYEKKNNIIESKEYFGLYDIPIRLQELATTLNDCKQLPILIPAGTEQIERQEEYEVFVKPTFASHITLLFLAFSLVAVILGCFKFLWKFITNNLSD